LKRFSAQVTEPTAIPLIAYPKAWSPGLSSPLTADVVYFDAKTEADFEKFKGKLNGKIVLTAPMRDVSAHFDPLGTRLNEKDLLTLADAPEPRAGGNRGNFAANPQFRAAFELANAKMRFFQSEGAALLIDRAAVTVARCSCSQRLCLLRHAIRTHRQRETHLLAGLRRTTRARRK
jgi:hypothetical protein